MQPGDWFRSPVGWANHGRLSAWLARAVRTRPPSILVLSMPRSGSSWVGETLGGAPDAAYLREPVNQTFLKLSGVKGTLVSIDPRSPHPLYQRAADLAFSGLPLFSAGVVKFPEQWRLLSRPRRRLVIKEVNPEAAEFFLTRYRPRVVFLVRHPAAVANSSRALGWAKNDVCGHARRHGQALRSMMNLLGNYPDHRVIVYERLCQDPVAHFRDLFQFVRLTWTPAVEESVRVHAAGGDRGDTYGTFRNSRDMIDAWRDRFSASELAGLRETYASFDLPWYRSDADW